MAAPTKWSPGVQARICDAIAIGATLEHAAQYGGISYETLNQWRKRNVQFSDALKAAEALGVVACLARIRQAAEAGTWQAAAWVLERRYPHVYGRTVQAVEHSGPDGGPVQHEVSVDVDGARERLRGRIVELAARRGAGLPPPDADGRGGASA